MKRILFIISLTILSFLSAKGDEKPVLKFNARARFKIVQFTDIHIQYDAYRSDSTLVMMRAVIQREKPDLVVLTGDVVGSDNRKKAWLKVAQVMIDAKVPWAAVLGNHDAEYELDKEQTMNTIVGLPYNLTIAGPKELAGKGNYVLPIQASKSEKTAAVLYGLDSEEREPNVKDWMDESQVQWYKEQSAALTKQNNGTPLPALAFFHIPFPEFADVVGKSTTYGINYEKLHSKSSINSNLFKAFQEKKDVMGVFVGHEHNNNYIGNINDICLAFGQAGGRQIYGDLGSGARVIELHEGQRKFDSWILKLYDNSRELDLWKPTHSKERMFFVTYPDSFTEKKANADKISMITEGRKVNIQLSGPGSATIDWGDGSKKEVLTLKESVSQIDHTYPAASTRAISINGDNITTLICKGAGLTYLDVSKNAELTSLDCSDNRLMQLNISHNTALKTLWCNGNQLTNLDVNKNTLLAELYCYRNRLMNLDVSKNTALTWLNCYQNDLRSLDLSKTTALRRLDCYENRLMTLDFSKNTALTWLVCTDNQFTTETMNALFASLHKSASPAKLFIGGNPGERDCDRSLAKSKNWTVSLRY
ncbi:metallophosphoesterase family protein [Dyadobacter sp. CY323]|uniref:metallophosphoesterase family protein n=1 Tax=Dyadobacter sp. CY323 TaxID=2907302 RepID=UPI001F24E6DB|nr:metallophosphoesterase family protein [Dyadobacter sp. CY323]MCE6989858.1 metallophosphoesterase [Dyadobacter sp. CY323]